MAEVKGNIRLGLGDGWIKVGAARFEKCGLEERIVVAEKVG